MHYLKVLLSSTTNNLFMLIILLTLEFDYITFEREIKGHYNMFNNYMSHFYSTIVNFTFVNNGTNNHSNHSNSSTNMTLYTKNCQIKSTFLHFRSDYQCYNISEARRVMHYSDCHRYNWLS